MKYHKQKYLVVPGGNQRGSCLQTAIACILDLELDQVPPFHLFYWSKEEDEILQKMMPEMYHTEEYQKTMYERAYTIWHDALTFFMASKGIKINQLYAGPDVIPECHIDNWLKENPGVIYTATGPSSRGVIHIVVYKDGQMIHDPHPSNEGLVSVNYYNVYKKIL